MYRNACLLTCLIAVLATKVLTELIVCAAAGRDRATATPTPPGTPPLHSPKSQEHNEEACSLLHIATISGVLAALMRHFR